jgi:hypothetical protein
MKCRLFDILVEPVMSYASHVWGPELFHGMLFNSARCYSSAADKTHWAYLRIMAGLPKSVAIDFLLRDLHRWPVMHHWVRLAARWWGKLKAMGRDGEGQSRLAYNVWVDDIKLTVRGCRKNWTYMLLHTMEQLGVVDSQWRAPGATADTIMALSLDADVVSSKLTGVLTSRWTAVLDRRDPVTGLPLDARTAPSDGIYLYTHGRWVYPLDTSVAKFDCKNAPEYTKLCMPFKVLQCVARLRMGYAALEAHTGRFNRVPRSDRLCKLCSCEDSRHEWKNMIQQRTGTADNVEDLKHFVLECPAYDHICQQYRCLFRPNAAHPYCTAVLHRVFAYEDQEEVATSLYCMWSHRSALLEAAAGQPPTDDTTLMAIVDA